MSIRNLWQWGHSKDGRTWLSHSAVTVLIGFIWGWNYALFYYWAREFTQILEKKFAGIPIPYVDCMLDALFPLWIAALAIHASNGHWWFFLITLPLPVAAVLILKRKKRL